METELKWRDLLQSLGVESYVEDAIGDEAHFINEVIALVMPEKGTLNDVMDQQVAKRAVSRFEQLEADDISFLIEKYRDSHKKELNVLYKTKPWLKAYEDEGWKDHAQSRREACLSGLYVYYQQLAYELKDELEAIAKASYVECA